MEDTREERHRRARERFIAAERREVEGRRNGQLSKVLGMPILPGETRAELARIGEEDRLLAEQGLVELKNACRDTYHKHVGDLVLKDRTDRTRAHGAQEEEWLTERAKRPRHTPQRPG